jgi:hypothetical protein
LHISFQGFLWPFLANLNLGSSKFSRSEIFLLSSHVMSKIGNQIYLCTFRL